MEDFNPDTDPAMQQFRELEAIIRTVEFQQKCEELTVKIMSGAPMTLEQIAKALGVPWAYFATHLAIIARVTNPDLGVSVDFDKSALN